MQRPRAFIEGPAGALRRLGRTLVALALRPLTDRPVLHRYVGAALRAYGVQLEVHHMLPVTVPHHGTLFQAGPAIATQIRTPEGIWPQDFAPMMFPAIGYRVIADAVVTARSSGVLSPAGAFRRRPVNGEDLILHPGAVPRIRAHSGDAVVAAWRNEARIDSALMLCGMWTYNYYHWLTEYLPVLWSAQRLPEDLRRWPVIVDRSALALPFVRQTLDLMLDGGELIAADPRCTYRVGRLVVLDPPKLIEARLGQGRVDEYLGEAMHAEAMHSFRSDLLERLGLGHELHEPGVRIVAVRPAGASRPDNQDEVVRRLEPLGFVAVDPGQLSVREQARLFRRAEFICGPAGAAMTNLLFAGDPTRAVVWGRESVDLKRGWWPNLAAVGGAEVTMIPLRPDKRDTTRGFVEPDEVVVAFGESLYS